MVSISWIPLFSYHFVMFSGINRFFFILMTGCEHWGFYYAFAESELVCLHFMLGFLTCFSGLYFWYSCLDPSLKPD